mmetsp:Transcript_7985/g.11397  ORF Transcript_7985/g.11397 Transcript_7985/m.11397 type:complete len:310 (-) Transcript_7985:188-1117(-)
MVLYIIGLGLGNEKDITVRGLEAVKRSSQVFLEMYTSILAVDKTKLEEFYNKTVTVADRDFVECRAEEIYGPAKTDDIALLVVGDPVCATTHTDIMLRAQHEGVKVELIHNASAMGAVGCSGLQLYNFGQTVSIPFFDDKWRPISFYEKIAYNRKGGMHTLCLLDIKVKEPDFDAMSRGKIVYLPPRYMSVNVACKQLIEAEERMSSKQEQQDGDEDDEGRGDASSSVSGGAYDPSKTLCVGMARLGQSDQAIVAGTMEELVHCDLGEPLHCMAICGEVHDLELEYLKQFLIEESAFVANDHKENGGKS